MKQVFDISEEFIVGQSDETYGVSPINWDDLSWKQLSLVGDEWDISLSHVKVNVFADSVLMLGKHWPEPTIKHFWEDKLTWFKSSP